MIYLFFKVFHKKVFVISGSQAYQSLLKRGRIYLFRSLQYDPLELRDKICISCRDQITRRGEHSPVNSGNTLIFYWLAIRSSNVYYPVNLSGTNNTLIYYSYTKLPCFKYINLKIIKQLLIIKQSIQFIYTTDISSPVNFVVKMFNKRIIL